MFTEQFRRIWWKRLRRDVEPRRCVRRNDQLGRSVGNGGIFFDRRKHRHGRKRLGWPALDGWCYRLGWPALDGRCYQLGWIDGDGRNDSRAIGRRDRHRREVGDWWAHRNGGRCAWR